MKKRIILILFSILFICNVSVFAADYKITSYKIDANVMENGDLEVTEYIKYSFTENMNGLYRDILYSYRYRGQEDSMEATSSRYQATGISDLEVFISDSSFSAMKRAIKYPESSLQNGMDGYYSAEFSRKEESRLLVKVYSPIDSGEYKYVKYKYVIKDALVNYSDYSELYWNFIGGDWQCSISDVDITINLPDETSITAYGHSYGRDGKLEKGSKSVNYKISYLGSYVAADVRVVFPNTIMQTSEIQKQVNGMYDFDNLYKIEAKLEKNIRMQKQYVANFVIIIVALVLTGIVIIIRAGRSKNGVIKNYKKAPIFTDMLENYSLQEYNKMLGAYNSSLTGNVIIATIMDLAHKKVINMDARKKMSTKKDKYEYMLSLNSDADFSKLTKYEKIIINYIFFMEYSDEISISKITSNEIELNDRFKTLSNKTTLANKIRNAVMRIDEEEKKSKYDNAPASEYKPALMALLVFFIIFSINIFVFCPTESRVSAFITTIMPMIMFISFVSIIIYSKGIRLKDAYVTEHNNLLGLKKYLSEYSLLKERYPIEIALWDRYMVFACLFGIAEKVAKEFKEELVARGLSEDEINSTYSYMYMANHINSYSSNISAATYAGSSSSSSGGFHGGGGGGRRWWRRRSLLITSKFDVIIK